MLPGETGNDIKKTSEKDGARTQWIDGKIKGREVRFDAVGFFCAVLQQIKRGSCDVRKNRTLPGFHDFSMKTMRYRDVVFWVSFVPVVMDK